MIDDARAPDAAARADAPAPSWAAIGQAMAADAVAALRERLLLAALEGQQFVHAAGRLLAFGVAAAVLALTAWFVIVAAAVALLVHAGLPLAAALAVGAVLNGAGAVFAWSAMRRQLGSMGFAATLRSLHAGSAAPPATSPTPLRDQLAPNAQAYGAVPGADATAPDRMHEAARASNSRPTS